MIDPEWLGRRVVVRRWLEHPTPDGKTRTDVLGELADLDGRRAVLDAGGGPVEIDLVTVDSARLVEPSAAAALEIERVASLGWRAAETQWLGGWLLRAERGWTGRANSALPLRAPGRPMAQMLADVIAWYAERDLPARLHVPYPARRLLDAFLADTPFREPDELPRTGVWLPGPTIDVLAGRLDRMPALTAPNVELAPTPSPQWLAVSRGGTIPAAGVALLARHDRVAFVTVRDSAAATVGVVRGVVDDGWLGVTALEVPEPHRHRGYGRVAMAAIVDWARREHGATRGYLQVHAANAAATGLYRRLSWYPHHTCRYWDHHSDPAASAIGSRA